MKDEEMFELEYLFTIFSKNRNCCNDCGNCEFSIFKNYGDSSSCPIDIVRDMIYLKFYHNKLYKELVG